MIGTNSKNTPKDKDTSNEKEFRILKISQTTYNVLCQADKDGLDASQGLENLAQMFLALSGPIDPKELAFKRAQAMAKKIIH